MARRDGYSVIFSLNILNGGAQDKDGVYDCVGAGQAGKGTYGTNCRMTPDQVRQWGNTLGSAGCALLMWRYDDRYMADSEQPAGFPGSGHAPRGIACEIAAPERHRRAAFGASKDSSHDRPAGHSPPVGSVIPTTIADRVCLHRHTCGVPLCEIFKRRETDGDARHAQVP